MVDKFKNDAIKNPVVSPIKLCKIIQNKRIDEIFSMLSRFSEKITPIINAIKNSDTLGKKIFIDLIWFATGFNNNPKRTGKKTIKKDDLISFITSTLIFSLVKNKIRNGVIITENNVDINVHIIDSATSALHKYEIKFDAVPPGQLPRIIIPKAYSDGMVKIWIKKYAVSGITVNWRKTVIKIICGFKSTFLIWEKFKVIPIPNITNPNKRGIKPFSEERKLGNKYPKVKKVEINKIKLNLESTLIMLIIVFEGFNYQKNSFALIKYALYSLQFYHLLSILIYYEKASFYNHS